MRTVSPPLSETCETRNHCESSICPRVSESPQRSIRPPPGAILTVRRGQKGDTIWKESDAGIREAFQIKHFPRKIPGDPGGNPNAPCRGSADPAGTRKRGGTCGATRP